MFTIDHVGFGKHLGDAMFSFDQTSAAPKRNNALGLQGVQVCRGVPVGHERSTPETHPNSNNEDRISKTRDTTTTLLSTTLTPYEQEMQRMEVLRWKRK
jgi:hypothetical protein